MGMDKESLHDGVDALGHTNWHVKAIVHALIDLGRVDALICQFPTCVLDSREFRPRVGGRGYEAFSLTLDHIDPRANGGGHRPENLRLLHHACNMAAERGRVDSPEVRATKRAGRAKWLAEGDRTVWLEAMRARPTGWNLKTRPDDRRGGMKPMLLTKEQVMEARALKSGGAKLEELAVRFRVSRSTMHSVVTSKAAYAAV